MNFCLDANVFFSFQKGINIGTNPIEVLESISYFIDRTGHAIYVPKKIEEEVRLMADGELLSHWLEFLTKIKVKTPDIYTHSISTGIMSDFVNDYRNRAYRGMKIAEESIIQSAGVTAQKTNRVDIEKALQPIKEGFRNRYRNATRTGTIDSQADLELIILTIQEKGKLVSADDGVRLWGQKFGAEEMDLVSFGNLVRG
jgi:RNA ligase partner protein